MPKLNAPPTALFRARLVLLLLLALGGLALLQPLPAHAQPATSTLDWEETGLSLTYPADWGTVDTRERGVRRISPVDVASLDRQNPDTLLVTLRVVNPADETANLPDISPEAQAADPTAFNGRLQTYALLQLNTLLLTTDGLQGVEAEATDYGYLVRAQLAATTTTRAAILLTPQRAISIVVQDPDAVVTDAAYDALLQSITIAETAPSAAPPAANAADFTLEPLEWVQGELSATTPSQQWTFSANPGDYVAVYLTPLAEDFQPQVIVSTAPPPTTDAPADNDDTTATDQDANQGEPLAVGLPSIAFPLIVENQQLMPRQNPDATDYVVTVQQFAGLGPYEMRFATSPDPIDIPAAFEFDIAPSLISEQLESATLVEPPASVPGTIGGDDASPNDATDFAELYRFTARAGQYITVQMIAADASALDTFVELYAGEQLIASNDDVFMLTFDAAVANVVAPVDGTYYARATNTFGTGDYTLHVLVTDTPEPTAAFPGVTAVGTLEPGRILQSTLTEGSPVQLWTFEGQAEQVITLRMSATDEAALDTQLWLFGPAGTLLTLNDDADIGTYNSRISAYTLPADGTYTVLADAFSGQGEYRIEYILETE